MIQLTERYRPRAIAEFVGLEKARAIMKKLAADPWESAWLFVGASGTGKTSLALALVEEMKAELHHIPSRQCDLETVQAVIDKCAYIPFGGGWHVLIVDEADQMSRAAQLAFLSKLDATARPAKTIFIFTANETKLLEDRFLSRCRILTFSEEGLGGPAAALLARVWAAEGGTESAAPDFARLFRESGNNIRAALNNLELELLEPGIGVAQSLGSERPDRERKRERCGAPAKPRPAITTDALDAYAVARHLGINVATLYNRVKMGRIPEPDRSGRKMIWNRAQIEAA